MICHKCKCCTFSWFSGFFALASIVHIVRLIVKTSVQVGSFVVPMNVSIAVAVIAGALSLVFCKMGCKACNCSK